MGIGFAFGSMLSGKLMPPIDELLGRRLETTFSRIYVPEYNELL